MIWGFAFVAQCGAADKINMFLLIGVRYFFGVDKQMTIRGYIGCLIMFIGIIVYQI